jgi:Tfp pilus assembly protein PilV
VTATAVTRLAGGGSSQLTAKLRGEEGVGLIELLIAILVLNVGIFATLAAFTSGALALRRASHVSTAAAIADQEMEKLRNSSYTTIAQLQTTPQVTDPWQNSPDGRSYKVNVSATPVTPTGGTQIELVTVKVYDDADQNKLLVTSSSTFSQCGQDLTNTACGGS